MIVDMRSRREGKIVMRSLTDAGATLLAAVLDAVTQPLA